MHCILPTNAYVVCVSMPLNFVQFLSSLNITVIIENVALTMVCWLGKWLQWNWSTIVTRLVSKYIYMLMVSDRKRKTYLCNCANSIPWILQQALTSEKFLKRDLSITIVCTQNIWNSEKICENSLNRKDDCNIVPISKNWGSRCK